jgi:hypothetical protein
MTCRNHFRFFFLFCFVIEPKRNLVRIKVDRESTSKHGVLGDPDAIPVLNRGLMTSSPYWE